MKLYQSKILLKLPMTHRAMITERKYSVTPTTGEKIAQRLSWTLEGRSIDKRLIADFKNDINEFCVENKLPFIIGSSAKGYRYLDLKNNPEEAMEEIERTINTLRNRALSTLKHLKYYKRAKRQISFSLKYE